MVHFSRLHIGPLFADQREGALRLSLPWDERTRSRLVLMTDGGEAVGLQLPRGTVLRDGAVLASDDGRFAVIEAASQRLARIEAEPALLLRIVYHLANRHVEAELAADHVLIEDDPVLVALARQLGATVSAVEAPFEPETGAYLGHGHHHRHAGDGDAIDDVSPTVGEQLSIEAHRRRNSARAAGD